METVLPPLLYQNIKQFKSYYVVWKLRKNALSSHRHLRLNRTMQYGNFSPPSGVFAQHIGLNRTMQYGNFGNFEVLFVLPTEFKSYYVVWKLLFFNTRFKKHIKCLNRTMQYGNHYIFPIFDTLQQFKSYYVVWKRIPPHHFVSRYPLFKSYYVVWKLFSPLLQ